MSKMTLGKPETETPNLSIQDLRELLEALRYAYKKDVYEGEALGNVMSVYSKVRKFINEVNPDSSPIEGLMN
jgi:hypothetical protein